MCLSCLSIWVKFKMSTILKECSGSNSSLHWTLFMNHHVNICPLNSWYFWILQVTPFSWFLGMILFFGNVVCFINQFAVLSMVSIYFITHSYLQRLSYLHYLLTFFSYGSLWVHLIWILQVLFYGFKHSFFFTVYHTCTFKSHLKEQTEM